MAAIKKFCDCDLKWVKELAPDILDAFIKSLPSPGSVVASAKDDIEFKSSYNWSNSNRCDSSRNLWIALVPSMPGWIELWLPYVHQLAVRTFEGRKPQDALKHTRCHIAVHFSTAGSHLWTPRTAPLKPYTQNGIVHRSWSQDDPVQTSVPFPVDTASRFRCRNAHRY